MEEAKMSEYRRQTECGFGLFRPSWIRPLAGIRSFIAVYGILSLLSWSLYAVIVSQVTNIERAFGFSSSETGWLLTGWEVGFIFSVVIASYFSHRAHIPHVLGYATFLYGFAGLITIIAHFAIFRDTHHTVSTVANATETEHIENLCASNRSGDIGSTNAPEQAKANVFSQKTIAYVIFCVAFVLQGAGKGPCHPYSSQYVDDNGNKDKTAYYMGIVYAIAIFGLVVGYGIGSLVSNIHVTLKAMGPVPIINSVFMTETSQITGLTKQSTAWDPFPLYMCAIHDGNQSIYRWNGPKTSLSTTDTRYIGAWWLGFLIVSVATLLISIPMICFPRHLKMVSVRTTNRKPQHKRTLAVAVKELKAAGMTVVDILRSPVYTFSVLASVFQTNALACFFAYEPKYMETQYVIPSWKANIIVGAVSISTFSVGSMAGGYITKRWKMTPFVLLRLVFVLTAIGSLLTVVFLFIGCPNYDIRDPYNTAISNHSADLESCDCDGVQFLPICGDDGHTYFSPCHAGCQNGTLKSFSNCSAIPGGSAVAGLCSMGCNNKMLWVFSAIKIVQNSIDSTGAIPMFLVFLRSGGEERKAMALALSTACASVFGWMPGPTIGGKIVDGTCHIWGVAKTSGIYCAHYNREWLRYHINGLVIGWRVLCLICLALATFKARQMTKWPGQEEEIKPSQEEVPMIQNGAKLTAPDSTTETKTEDNNLSES